MALKIRGESEFTVRTVRDPSEILSVARQVLTEFEAQESAVRSAEISPEHSYDFQIRIVLSVSSYAQAEELMTRLRSRLTDALVGTVSETVAGPTELVPA